MEHKNNKIQSSNGRKRLNCIGYLNLTTMDVHHKIYDKEAINAKTFIESLEMIKASYKDKAVVHIFLDNAGYHKNKEVAEYIAQEQQQQQRNLLAIQLHYLPAGSPNLNPIERLWKIMHEYVSNNKVYTDFKEFKQSILNFFNNTLPNIKPLLYNRITDNFHILGENKEDKKQRKKEVIANI
jgi:transposase